MGTVWDHVVEAVNLTLATTVALAALAGAAILLETAGAKDFVKKVRQILRIGDGEPEESATPVNVDFLDRLGVLVDLGRYIVIMMHNTSGKTYVAIGGVFLECNSAWIRPSVMVHLNIQDGKHREDLIVRYHPTRKTLYVQSSLSVGELFAKVNAEPLGAPQSV